MASRCMGRSKRSWFGQDVTIIFILFLPARARPSSPSIPTKSSPRLMLCHIGCTVSSFPQIGILYATLKVQVKKRHNANLITMSKFPTC